MKTEKKNNLILEKLLKADFEFKNEKGDIIEIPVKGSLGLLASGYKGLIAVRKKRNQLKS